MEGQSKSAIQSGCLRERNASFGIKKQSPQEKEKAG